MYICLCKGIREAEVQALGRSGICSAEALALTLGLEEEGLCGRCLRNIDDLVDLATRGTRDLAGDNQHYVDAIDLICVAMATSQSVQHSSY